MPTTSWYQKHVNAEYHSFEEEYGPFFHGTAKTERLKEEKSPVPDSGREIGPAIIKPYTNPKVKIGNWWENRIYGGWQSPRMENEGYDRNIMGHDCVV